MLAVLPAICNRRSLGIVIRVSTLLCNALDGLLGIAPALGALEGEGPRHHADGQRAHLAGHIGHDGRGAGAGAAAHAGRDKDHVGAAEHLAQFVAALLAGTQADLGVAARTQPLGDLLADAQPLWRRRQHQRLGIGVDGDELDALDALFDHAVDGVLPAAAHADDFDLGKVVDKGRLCLGATGHCSNSFDD